MLNNHEQIKQHINKITIEGRAFINGRYCEAKDKATFACHSPIDGRLLQQVTECGQAEVDHAVMIARKCFQSGEWSRSTPRDRKNVLLAFADLLQENFVDLCLLETLDSGKPISDVINSDLPLSIECLRWYAEAIDKLWDEYIPTERQYLGLVAREPMGVIAAIVPWNYPLLMAMWKIAPALATGNSVLLKPSERSPLTALRIAHLAEKAGLPTGVLQVLPGSGRVGMLLSQHGDIDCVAFTGSGITGRKIMHAAADSNLKRVWLELGGKTPHIILADCPDIEKATQAVANGIFLNMGEVCNAGSRLLVHRSLKETVIQRLQTIAPRFYPGNPLDPATVMGALIDEIHLNRVLDYIKLGHKEAKLLLGGQQVHQDTGGYYIEPTIFDCENQAVTIAREEIFGPVLSVITFTDTAEAIRLANDTEYGLAAGLWTADMNQIHQIAQQLRAGTVWVNCFDEPADMSFPFGGYKQSGHGRDKSLHALEKYTELKATIIRLGS